MDLLHVVVIVAALLCGMVTGLLFGFAVVAMPGIGTMEDREFLRGFRVMDRVIQDNQPLFMIAWMGSVLAGIAVVALGIIELEGTERVLAILGPGIYLVGVQLPTAAINIPLNNAVQSLDLDAMNARDLARARKDFESRWNGWNAIRTALGAVATTVLLVLLLRL